MDIHKPKPWHGFREFLKEYLIIVIGVLTALAAEAVVEALRWQAAVEQARQSIHEEIAFNDAFLEARVRIQPCVARRLDQIEAALTAAEASGRIQTVPGAATGLSAQISDAQWQAARSAQTLAHFPHGELAVLGRYYDIINTFKVTFLDREGEAWRWLGDLERAPHGASSSDLMQLGYQLRTARVTNRNIPGASKTMLGIADQLGVKPATRDMRSLERVCEPA